MEKNNIIVLDTCVCRALAKDQESMWFPQFCEMQKHGCILCLAEVAMAELINSFIVGVINQDEWRIIWNKLSNILYTDYPILPGKRHLFQMAGIKEKNMINDYDEDFEKGYSHATFKMLSKTVVPNDLSCDKIFETIAGNCYTIHTIIEKVNDELKKERCNWIGTILKDAERYKGENIKKCMVKGVDYKKAVKYLSNRKNAIEIQKDNEKSVFEKLREDIDSNFISTVCPASKKMDILLKYMARLIAHAANMFEPYNPNSEKKKNDGIDMQLLHTLMLPARVCSLDHLKTVRNIDSNQAKWILTPDELVHEWNGKGLFHLSWQ